MKSFDRFEMEQQLLDCWGICEDLDILMEGVLEHDLSKDQISNILIGMKELYALKFDKLFNTFEAGVRTRGIISTE